MCKLQNKPKLYMSSIKPNTIKKFLCDEKITKKHMTRSPYYSYNNTFVKVKQL